MGSLGAYIKTKGWPFNRDASQFAELLLKELDGTAIKINQAVKIASYQITTRNQEEAVLRNSILMQPDLSLTDLDRKILSTIQNPEAMKENAIKLSQINQAAVLLEVNFPDNADQQKEKSKEESQLFAKQWYEKFNTVLTHWQQKEEHLVFNKREEGQLALSELLSHADQLSEAEKKRFVTVWQGLKALISLELTDSDGLANSHDSQISSLISLIEVLKTQPNTADRQTKLAYFNQGLESLFPKDLTRSSLSMQGYVQHGLLRPAPIMRESSLQSAVDNSPGNQI